MKRVMMGRVSEFYKRRGTINKWQCAGEQMLRRANVLVNEKICYLQMEKRPDRRYVGMLDAKKADDTLCQNALCL